MYNKGDLVYHLSGAGEVGTVLQSGDMKTLSKWEYTDGTIKTEWNDNDCLELLTEKVKS